MIWDYIVTYGVMTLDVLMLLAFFYIVFTNLPIKRLAGAVKGILLVVVLWFISRLLNFYMAEAVLGQIIQYGFLAMIILFPTEFRKMLENVGRRRVFGWNTNRLIERESRQELAEAVVSMARRKQGAVIVIAREDGLDEESEKGTYIGEMAIKKEFIELLFDRDSKVSTGAVIIKDDMIISSNVRLPIANNRQLEDAGAGRRHLAGLGVVLKRDCVSIVVSGDTGYITMIGRLGGEVETDFALPLREFDLQDGIDETYIVDRLEDFLKGKDEEVIQAKKQKKKKKQEPKKKPAEKPKKAPKEKGQKGKENKGKDNE